MTEPSPGRRSRRKGSRGEGELVAILKSAGWTDCRRNFGSGSQGGGDLVYGPEGTSWECKRVERLNIHKAFDQAKLAARATDTPIVAHRRNGGPWLVTLELDELLPLLRLRES